MMGTRGELKGGDEWDVFSRLARRCTIAKKGERRKVKRRFWKRERKLAQTTVRAETYVEV